MEEIYYRVHMERLHNDGWSLCTNETYVGKEPIAKEFRAKDDEEAKRRAQEIFAREKREYLHSGQCYGSYARLDVLLIRLERYECKVTEVPIA